MTIKFSKLYGQQNPDYFREFPAWDSRYLGFGFGINDFGAGFSIEFPLAWKLSGMGSAGLGGWGWKLAGGLMYYPGGGPYYSSFGLGYSYATGLLDLETQLNTTTGNNTYVRLDLMPVSTINLFYFYNLPMDRSHKVVFSAGYSFPITRENYVVKSPVVLTPDSEHVLKILQPGGLIVGLKFMFSM